MDNKRNMGCGIITLASLAWLALMTCLFIVLVQVVSTKAMTPYIDGATGEWVYEIDEAPPINNISTALEEADGACPISEAVPLSEGLQRYVWEKCKAKTDSYRQYYTFILGAMQHESSFKAKATHHNDNGTIDRGIMQINSSNIGKMKRAGLIGQTEDLYDPYKCIDCGFHMMDSYIDMFGITEDAYYAYNTGREHGGSNRNSRTVMGYMSEWNRVLFGGE